MESYYPINSKKDNRMAYRKHRKQYLVLFSTTSGILTIFIMYMMLLYFFEFSTISSVCSPVINRLCFLEKTPRTSTYSYLLEHSSYARDVRE